MQKKLFSLEMSEQLLEQLRKEANDKETTVSALIRTILKAYFENNDSTRTKDKTT